MTHYLVTGGAGFIGSNLIRTIFNKGEEVRITTIDNFDPFYSEEIKQLNIRDFAGKDQFKLIRKDLALTTGKELTELIPEKVDAIIHLAAKAGVRPSILNPVSYQQANIIGLQNLLDFAKEKKK